MVSPLRHRDPPSYPQLLLSYCPLLVDTYITFLVLIVSLKSTKNIKKNVYSNVGNFPELLAVSAELMSVSTQSFAVSSQFLAVSSKLLAIFT